MRCQWTNCSETITSTSLVSVCGLADDLADRMYWHAQSPHCANAGIGIHATGDVWRCGCREDFKEFSELLNVNQVSLADLRANKKAAGRLKDLNDLENLPELLSVPRCQEHCEIVL